MARVHAKNKTYQATRESTEQEQHPSSAKIDPQSEY
jgi:hypothetical protein